MSKLVELKIKDFRAVKQADIQVNGITVVAGVNGCGKSTLSKFLYYAFKNSNSFEDLVLQYVNSQLRPYINVIEQLTNLYYHYISIDDYRNLRRFNNNKRLMFRSYYLSDLSDTSSFLDGIQEFCNRVLDLENNMNLDGKSIVSTRLNMIFRSILKNKDSKLPLKHKIEELIRQITELIHEAERMVAERPYKILRESMEASFNSTIPKNTLLQEYGDSIIGDKVSNVPLPHYIKKVAYIDTPMVIGMETYSGQPTYWEELNNLIKTLPKRGYKRSINKYIKEEILKGDASFDSDVFSGGFKYKTLAGEEFDLLECATGIKSFSLLQMLLKNLFLDESTLLIIDEPEAHLHPQWIVEYAHLIVLIHKRIGVKFFLASHSTDMVSAIRYISEKEKCLSAVSFYVAEEDSNKKNTYNFKSLGHDIEPIFESFNKSFTTLDRYVK